MVIACKSCKKVFRRPPIAEWEDADEYCPHCDAHILVEPELAKGAESGRRMAAWHSRSPCPCLCQWTMAATLAVPQGVMVEVEGEGDQVRLGAARWRVGLRSRCCRAHSLIRE